MRYRRRDGKSESEGLYVLGAVKGLVVTVLCLVVFSAVMTYVSASPAVVTVMSNIALCAGSVAAGYAAAKKRRKNGILTGILTGAIIYGVVYFLGVVVLGRFASMTNFSRLIMIIICGSVGGIIGVNTDITKRNFRFKRTR